MKRKTTQSEHDKVVRASANTYTEADARGFKVSINPNGEKNFVMGGEGNKQYPDVCIWKPSSPGSNSGDVSIIEEIETEESVTENEAEQWKDYASLGIQMFRLIVPKSKVSTAKQIVEKKKISVTEIWSYTITNGTISFSKN